MSHHQLISTKSREKRVITKYQAVSVVLSQVISSRKVVASSTPVANPYVVYEI